MSEEKITMRISPKSCAQLDTPFVLYFQKELANEIGEEKATAVMDYTYSEMARMDEGVPKTPIEHDMSAYGYPMLAVYRGLIKLGYGSEDSFGFVKRTWEKIPKELKARPWEKA